MTNTAIILASGSSERLNNLSTVKQFAKIAGKTVIEHTLDVFEKNKNIDSVIVVTRADFIEHCNELIFKNNYKKIINVISGGKTRQESSKLALLSLNLGEDDNVLIHDAVRPFVSDKIINDCIKALDLYSAVDVGIPSADTIIQVDEKDIIKDIPKRKYLRRGQTPQAFKYGIIKQAHLLAESNQNIEVTDDCGLIKNFNLCDVYVVNGDDCNIKITYPIDIDIADKLFQIRAFEPDNTSLENIKDKIVVVFGGTSGIGKDIAEYTQTFGARVYCFSRKNNVDVSVYNKVENALYEVFQKEGRIDWVINSAGILKKGLLEDRNIDDILTEINVNYVGSINVLKASAKYLKASKGGMLLFASSSYTRGRAEFSIYSSTKAALVNLTQAAAEELNKDGVKINIINPERTATPMRYKNFGPEPKDSLLDSKTVAIVSILTLLSPISGQVINVTRANQDVLGDYLSKTFN